MKKYLYRSLVFALLACATRVSGSQDPTGPLRDEIAASPATAPAAVTRLLRGAGPQAAGLGGRATSAAIECLGPKASAKQISSVVFAAVRAMPDSVLEIVHAAVVAAPKDSAEIAAAAASAVPHPWKEVRYHRNFFEGAPIPNSSVPMSSSVKPGRGERDFKSDRDPKDAVDVANKSEDPNAPFDPGDPGDPMTLAEAIVQTAFNSQTGIGLATIQIAVDVALAGDPSVLMNLVSGPRGISGVGDAGDSNFANEPHFRTPPPPVKPKAPPVSQ